MTMPRFQPGILQPVPCQSLHLHLSAAPGSSAADQRRCLAAIKSAADGKRVVIGLGLSLCKRLRLAPPQELHAFNAPQLAKVSLPPERSADLWLWLRGPLTDSAGTAKAQLLATEREVKRLAQPAFVVTQRNDCFRHGPGRDLTGYEDGTENPNGQAAKMAAFSTDGSSFVALQTWRHDWPAIQAMSERQRNLAIGRVRSSNDEIESAPDSAHVKRTAQEGFILADGSQGYTLRRSMPYSDSNGSRLVFTSFGKSLEAFEVQLARMSGADDGIVDALFSISKPLDTAYYWCPPL